jgi:hypothetical protein
MTKKSKSTKSAKKAKKSSKSARKGGAKKSTRSLMSVATSARNTVPERVAALAEAPLAVCESDDNLQALLKVLRDKNEPSPVRLAALQSLQAASFSVVAFEDARGDYLATLREVAEDTDMELRQRVLGILARENDGFAQKKLLEGLQHPEKALLPPEKALQLLSYDVHAEAYKAARDIVEKPPSDVARREALRLLAADATAAPLFEKLLRDKDELAEIRQISASALQSLKPEKLQEHAREILLDSSEYDEIQATSLTALTQFGDDEAIAQDEALLESVDRMSDEASTRVKQNARRFLSKYGK